MKKLITLLSIILFLAAITFATSHTFATEETTETETTTEETTEAETTEEATTEEAISLAKVASVKLNNSTYKQLTVTWSKVKKASGYEVQYSKKATMKKATTITISKNKTTCTIKKLKRNTTYYVQVRAFTTTSDGTVVYGAWSKIKKKTVKGKLVVIDAGHQSKGNYSKEAVGPGSSTTKTKTSSGTSGVSTKVPEYVLNLIVAKKLAKELKKRGYDVKMIRTTHDVNISNQQRAKLANKWGADAFIRIHADSSTSSSVNGASALCPASNNPYMSSSLITKSTKLASCVLNGLCDATGAKNRGLNKTNTMTGINWSEVPVAIVEMGFMSNPTEDKKMATAAYQKKIVKGIANGLDEYFGRK